MPGLPFDQMDILIVDELGKNISGAGMDTNVIGRLSFIGSPKPKKPRITRIFVRDLSEATHGNASGIGMADFTTKRLVDKIDHPATQVNCITSMAPEDSRIPIAFETDREAISAGIETSGVLSIETLRLVWIKNTLELEYLFASQAFLEKVRANPRLDVVSELSDLSFDQERLTSYEIGTKNRFFDKRLQLNGAVFYYDYEGYQEAVNIGQGPIPSFVIFALPVKMIGVEMDGQWLITPNDKASLSAGWLDAYLSSYPTKVANNTVLNTKDYLYFKQLPGIPKIMATLGYDHTFLFNNGSILTPHAEFRYTGGYYINQLSLGQVNLLPYDPRPYDYQSSNVLTNLTVTWTSSDTKFSMTGYIRNLFDKEYKAGLDIPSIGGPPGMSQSTIVTPGDPRTWGVMLRAKF